MGDAGNAGGGDNHTGAPSCILIKSKAKGAAWHDMLQGVRKANEESIHHAVLPSETTPTRSVVTQADETVSSHAVECTLCGLFGCVGKSC